VLRKGGLLPSPPSPETGDIVKLRGCPKGKPTNCAPKGVKMVSVRPPVRRGGSWTRRARSSGVQ
jgi:hypothetical protein